MSGEWFQFPHGIIFDGEKFGTNEISFVFKTKGTFLVPLSTGVDLVSNRWNEILRELSEWNQLKIAHEAHFATR
jgi:hypothetical protein